MITLTPSTSASAASGSKMHRETFGTTANGEKVERITIEGGGLSARFLTYGAVLQDLRLAGHAAPLVLGFERLEDYVAQKFYIGATVGRYANRIAGGAFRLDGEIYQTDRNDSINTLHGGSNGFDRRLWQIADIGPDFLTLTVADPSGAMGFPGTVKIDCTFSLEERGRLSIEMSATTDRTTLVNLAHHSYFNLDNGGAGHALDHRLKIDALAYMPVDQDCIPTGEVLPVAGTDFDFLMPRPIRLGDTVHASYDHNFCFGAARGPLRQMAWVQGAASGVEMQVWSTEPGLQFYSGQFPGFQTRGLEGRQYRTHAGFCLEPQVWPDSPNRPYFPQAILRPGEVYRQVTEYRFRSPDED